MNKLTLKEYVALKVLQGYMCQDDHRTFQGEKSEGMPLDRWKKAMRTEDVELAFNYADTFMEVRSKRK